MKDELKNAVEWLKEQKEIRQYVTYIGRSLYPLNTDFKGLLIEFLNEIIQLNQNLTDQYGLYDRKDNINLRDAVNNCFVCNKKMQMISFIIIFVCFLYQNVITKLSVDY